MKHESDTSKKALRKRLLHQRNELNYSSVETLSKQITEHLSYAVSSVSDEFEKIGLYMASNNEVLTSEIHHLFDQSLFYIPKIGPSTHLELNEKEMAFTPFNDLINDLKDFKNRYNISETSTFANNIEPCRLDIIFMPLVGFDRNGNRLGYGGGYYDRTLSFKNDNPTSRPLLIALAYDFQEVNSVPSNHWDVKPDLIITNNELIRINTNFNLRTTDEPIPKKP